MLGFNISYIDCIIEDITECFPIEGATEHEEILYEIVNRYEEKIQKEVGRYYKELTTLKEKYKKA